MQWIDQYFYFAGDPNLDQSCDENDADDVFAKFCDEYQQREIEYIAEFSDRRLPCYCHAIELVMKKFTTVDEIKTLFDQVLMMIRKLKGKINNISGNW